MALAPEPTVSLGYFGVIGDSESNVVQLEDSCDWPMVVDVSYDVVEDDDGGGGGGDGCLCDDDSSCCCD